MGIVAQETDSGTDVNVSGVIRQSEFILASGLLTAGMPLQRTKVVEVELEYESLASQSLSIEYSIDAGVTWGSYSTFDVTTTNGPTVIARRKTLSHHNIQLRLKSTTLGRLRVIGFYPRIVAGEKVNP